MLQEYPKKVTYAQQKLLELLTNHELKKWCDRNGLVHGYVYRLAYGEIPPTFRAISSMCHLIAPIDWFFYTDEVLPYAETVVPQWNYKNVSKYVTDHKVDYKYVAQKYNIDSTKAYNIFGLNRTLPSFDFIKQLAHNSECNPIEFFISAESKQSPDYVLSKGDIISVLGYLYLIVASKIDNDIHYCYCCKITGDSENISSSFIPLDNEIEVDSKKSKYVSPFEINTFIFNKDNIQFIDKVSDQIVDKVISVIKTLF